MILSSTGLLIFTGIIRKKSDVFLGNFGLTLIGARRDSEESLLKSALLMNGRYYAPAAWASPGVF